MPVLGHAFVGLATGMCMRPSNKAAAGPALWTPIVVGLAYLPDIAAQIMLLAGLDAWQPASHSVLLAPVASLAVAGVLGRLRLLSFGRAFAVALFCILLHDALDVLQGSDRTPWWPVSDRPVRFGRSIIPTGMYQELLLFGILFGVFLVWRRVWRKRRAGAVRQKLSWRCRPGSVWLGWALTASILAGAAGTHYLRGVRGRQFQLARTLLSDCEYRAAIAALDRADRWPSTAKPGRIDYTRAEALAQLQDREQAERYYLRACQADPSYFWALADLTVFYASSDEPVEEKRRCCAPYIERLRREFADHKALPRVLSKLERKLAPPATESAATTAP